MNSLFLDAVRAGAAQAVVIGHAISFFGVLPMLQPPNMPWMQNVAVVIFFILSGFLIPLSTLRKLEGKNGYSFGEYLIDRFARIYSAFVPALLLILALDLINRWYDPVGFAYGNALTATGFIGNLLMLQDHTLFDGRLFSRLGIEGAVTSFGSGRPLWTVGIEWWIYLLFGLVVLKNTVRLGRGWWWAMVLACAVVPAENLLRGRGAGLTMCWLFGTGACLVVSRGIFNSASTNALRGTAVVFWGAALARLLWTNVAYDLPFAALAAAGMCCFLAAGARSDWKPGPAIIAAVTFPARYSYSLYLVHYSVLDLLTRIPIPGASSGSRCCVAIIAANLLAVGLAMGTEFHYRKFGRFLKRRCIDNESEAL